MRILRLRTCAALIALTTLASSAAAQGLSIENHMVVDELGNAKFKQTTKLTAQQFVNWQHKYGLNPALLKRDLEREFSQYVIENFNRQQNELERQVAITMDAIGAAFHEGDGHYRIELPKQWKDGERVGNSYRYHYAENTPEGLTQYTIRVELPASASDFRESKNEYGERVIQYRVPTQAEQAAQAAAASERPFPVVAILIAALGVVLAGASFFLPRDRRGGGTSAIKEGSHY